MEIYYFSGTGNSLALAREIGKDLESGARLIPMVSFLETGAVIEAEAVGLVFPVYFQTLPDIVGRFIAKARFVKAPYVFAAATCNAGPGYTLWALEKQLKRAGVALSLGFTVDMPGNSLIIRDFMNPESVQNERLGRAKEKAADIARLVNERRVAALTGRPTPGDYLRGVTFAAIVKRLYRTPRRFWVTDRCSRCGLCAGVCPMKNITLPRNGAPRWGNKCAQCLGCFHWCPNGAIEIGWSTAGKRRYTNPDVTAGDLMRQA